MSATFLSPVPQTTRIRCLKKLLAGLWRNHPQKSAGSAATAVAAAAAAVAANVDSPLRWHGLLLVLIGRLRHEQHSSPAQPAERPSRRRWRTHGSGSAWCCKVCTTILETCPRGGLGTHRTRRSAARGRFAASHGRQDAARTGVVPRESGFPVTFLNTRYRDCKAMKKRKSARPLDISCRDRQRPRLVLT